MTVLTGVFTTLKQQLETTKIEQVKELNYVIILDAPEPPLFRSKPDKTQFVILAGFFGIGLGIIIGFMREYLKNRDKDEIEKMDLAKTLVITKISDFIPQKFWKK